MNGGEESTNQVLAFVRELIERQPRRPPIPSSPRWSKCRASMRDLLNALVAQGERVVYGTGNWLDIDSLDDLVVGGSF